MCVTHRTNGMQAPVYRVRKQHLLCRWIGWFSVLRLDSRELKLDREKCLIRLLKPGDLGLCFKRVLHKEVLPLPEHHLQMSVLGWIPMLTDYKGETAKNDSMCDSAVSLLKAKCKGYQLENFTAAALMEAVALPVLTLLIMKSRSPH